MLTDRTDKKAHCVLVCLAARRRQKYFPKAIAAMDESRNGSNAKARPRRTDEDGDILGVEKLEQRQRVTHAQRHRNVSIGTRNPDQLEIGVR